MAPRMSLGTHALLVLGLLLVLLPTQTWAFGAGSKLSSNIFSVRHLFTNTCRHRFDLGC